ncbi:MAG: CotH kinase family protein [Chitinophagales bacterium]
MKTFYLTSCFLLCIVARLFAYDPGEFLFDETRIIKFSFTFYQEDYWQQLLDSRHTETYIKGDLHIDDISVSSVGVRLKGQSSWQIPTNKKSIKIDIDEFLDQEFDGLDKMNLNNGFSDPTFLREKIFYDYCKEIGISAPRANFAVVYINETYFGLYTLVEEVEKKFLDNHFDDIDGNLYKGDPEGDLSYYGEAPHEYKKRYTVETNREDHDWTDLIELIKKINLSEADKFEQQVAGNLYIPNFLSYWSSLILSSSLDSYIGSAHNYFLYNDEKSGKFYFIPWDCNETFGGYNYQSITGRNEMTVTVNYLPEGPEIRPLIERWLADPVLKNYYYTEIYTQMQTWFNESYFFPKIDEYANLIREAVYTDSLKMYTDSLFELNLDTMVHVTGGIGGVKIPGLKDLITIRTKFINAYFDSINFIPTPYVVNVPIPEVNHSSIVFYDNTLFIQTQESSLQIYSTSGNLMFEKVIHGAETLSLNKFSAGMYIYVLSTNREQTISGKCIRQ